MMQRIATSQSDVATLPVNIGGNEASSGQAKHDFRDMLESHKQPRPEVARPVDPIASETERAALSKNNAAKGAEQSSLDQKNAEIEEHKIAKDQQDTAQHIDEENYKNEIARGTTKSQSENTEKHETVANTSYNDKSANEVVDGAVSNPKQVSENAAQEDVEKLETKNKEPETKHKEPVEIDWLTLLNNIEYAKSNDLKSANAQENVVSVQEFTQNLISNKPTREVDSDNADQIIEANLIEPQIETRKSTIDPVEIKQTELVKRDTSEGEKNYLAEIQHTISAIANTLELSAEDQALLSDLAALIQLYQQQSETPLASSIDKQVSEQAEVMALQDISNGELIQQDIEQLLSQFFAATQRAEQDQFDLAEITLEQQSEAQIDSIFLAQLLVEEVTEQTSSTQPVSVDIDIQTTQPQSIKQSVSESDATETAIKSEVNDVDLDLTSEQQIQFAETPESISGSAVKPIDLEFFSDLEEVKASTEFDGLDQEIVLPLESAEQQEIEPKEIPRIPINSGNGLHTLASLPENKLDIAIRNLAQRLDELNQQSNDSITSQQSLVGKNVGAVETPNNPSFQMDFVKSLKQGIEDFKQKIKSGVQSGSDLNILVTDALNSAATLNKTAEIPPQQIEQVLNTFNHTLDSGLRLSGALEQLSINSPQSQRLMTREVTQQTQFEQTKQIHQQILGQEKAINITRSEGHQQLVEKVRWMVNQNNLQADIRLDPPDLGSVKVRVNLAGESASVNFIVQSQQARDVLEQAAPRLKELLDEQGIELGQSTVQQEQKDSQHEQQHFSGGASEPEPTELAQNTVVEQSIVNGRLGAIDYFV